LDFLVYHNFLENVFFHTKSIFLLICVTVKHQANRLCAMIFTKWFTVLPSFTFLDDCIHALANKNEK